MRNVKKIIIIFISIIVIFFLLICYMVYDSNKDIIEIEKNSKIDNIVYVNKYNNNYIICDKKYIYLLDLNYKQIFKIELDKLHENRNDYDIIYKDGTLMYMNSKYENDVLVYEYYDIYTYKLLNKFTMGG